MDATLCRLSSGDERIFERERMISFWGWTAFAAWKLTANSDQQQPFSLMYWSILSITLTEAKGGFRYYAYSLFMLKISH